MLSLQHKLNFVIQVTENNGHFDKVNLSSIERVFKNSDQKDTNDREKNVTSFLCNF